MHSKQGGKDPNNKNQVVLKAMATNVLHAGIKRQSQTISAQRSIRSDWTRQARCLWDRSPVLNALGPGFSAKTPTHVPILLGRCVGSNGDSVKVTPKA